MAWARFIDPVSLGPDLALIEATLLQHSYLGLSKNSAQFLDISSGGTFLHHTAGEGKKLLDKILENTHHTDVYDEPPKEDKVSSHKQGEISMAESPELLPRYFSHRS